MFIFLLKDLETDSTVGKRKHVVKRHNSNKIRLTKKNFNSSSCRHTCVTPHSSYIENAESVSDDSLQKSHFQDLHSTVNCECNTADVNKDDPMDCNNDSIGKKSTFEVNPNLSLLESSSHVILQTGDLCVYNNSVFVVDWVVHNPQIQKVKYAIKRPNTRPFLVSHDRVTVLDDKTTVECDQTPVSTIGTEVSPNQHNSCKREKKRNRQRRRRLIKSRMKKFSFENMEVLDTMENSDLDNLTSMSPLSFDTATFEFNKKKQDINDDNYQTGKPLRIKLKMGKKW